MEKYLVIGDGRVARHFCFYLRSLQIPYTQWSRRLQQDLNSLWASDLRVVLAVSDGALTSLLNQFPMLQNTRTVHFSGVRHIDGILSAHPLMTFGEDLYPADFYQTIPFCLDTKDLSLADVLPGLPNKSFYVPAEKRALYHALCVLGGNFTTILMESAARRFQDDLKVPKSVLTPYFQQVVRNICASLDQNSAPASSLTGPLARNDISTIVRNIDALTGTPEQELYYAFLNYANKSKLQNEGQGREHLSI